MFILDRVKPNCCYSYFGQVLDWHSKDLLSFSKLQRLVMTIGAILIVIAILFPPWYEATIPNGSRMLCFAYIFAPPKYYSDRLITAFKHDSIGEVALGRMAFADSLVTGFWTNWDKKYDERNAGTNFSSKSLSFHFAPHKISANGKVARRPTSRLWADSSLTDSVDVLYAIIDKNDSLAKSHLHAIDIPAPIDWPVFIEYRMLGFELLGISLATFLLVLAVRKPTTQN